MTLQVRVLGSAAGGGVPQWNSLGEACRLARAGDPRSPPRTQTGLAVSVDGHSWWLLDASPDLRQQLADAPALHPQRPPRHTPIRGVVLTGGDVDKVAGLLCLREGEPLSLLATRAVLDLLDATPIFEVLDRDRVERRTLPLDERTPLGDPSTAPSVTAFAVPGKVPRWREDPRDPLGGADPGHAVGLLVEGGGARVAYVPGCAAIEDGWASRLDGASAIFVDGTLWKDDEMRELGVSAKTGRRMGHVSISGADGALARLRGVDAGRKVLIHLNNTNPALIAGTPERDQITAVGWEVAFDGMEMTL
jgi:pyrroloquinoline quinone biosynthesis protein B